MVKFNILLVGDNCIDEYQYGSVERISPEAPVPVFQYRCKEVRPGMAANVMNNLKELNCDVTFITTGRSHKIRLIDEKTKHHLVRIDHDQEREPVIIPKDLTKFDAIVISDYNKGSVTYDVILDIMLRYKGPIFIDTKKPHLAPFEGCFIKVNDIEYRQATSLPEKHLIVTKGKEGATYNNKVFPGLPVEAFDVCGAGDTFLSALVYKYLYEGNIEKAIEYANIASSITVKHIGVYAPAHEEINKLVGELNIMS